MRLTDAQVYTYRNILDSTSVSVDDEVTCLVGKNESEKTAFLEALEWLNPARSDATMDVLQRYPAWRERQDRQGSDEPLESTFLVEATFELEDEDREALDERFGEGVVTSDTIRVRRNYAGRRLYTYTTDPEPLVEQILESAETDEALDHRLADVNTVEELDDILEEYGEVDGDVITESLHNLRQERQERIGNKSLRDAVLNELSDRLPRFFFFPEYATLPATVDIEEVLEADEANLSRNEVIARRLLLLASASQQYLQEEDYERRRRELENVANQLTNEILQYWSQNEELRVEVDIDPQTEQNQQGQQVVRRYLKVRMRDGRHQLTLPFDEKSTGFQWFFSFLASFSKFKWQDDPIIILLDEPALGLHAKAQKDFLRYIDEELAPIGQVFYTTHSPFMVQPNKLHRVRLVEDRGIEDGAEVVDDVLAIDPDTLFPLQGALGYDMAQHLFIGPNNLVVEGTSDFTYLKVISDYLDEHGRTSLDDAWSIVPVGGADLIPTFVALLGQYLDVTVLVDGQRHEHQKLNRLANDGYLANRRIIPIANFLGTNNADIEDVFAPEDYIKLFNRAFDDDIEIDDLEGDDPIVSQIGRYRPEGDFNHGRPANELLRERDEILPDLNDDTLANFEELFGRINQTREN